MSYGHFIVLPNQNRDTVQIILVQDKAVVKEYKAWETTRHNKISDGYHGSTCTTTYTIEIEINRAIYKRKPVKETCVNIPAVPLEFRLDPSI